MTLLNGAVIGADGFGFVEHEGDLIKVPQAGTVVIEDDVEIGANTTVDRATMGATLIRRGVKLDNLIQIGHNCDVGEFSRMAAQGGLAGSVRVGQWCQFGGQSGFADHVKVGDRTRVIAQAGVHNDLAADALVGGSAIYRYAVISADGRGRAALAGIGQALARPGAKTGGVGKRIVVGGSQGDRRHENQGRRR